MKKLILFCSLLCLFACNKEKSGTAFTGDLMFFAEIPVIPEGEDGIYIEPITTKTIDTEKARSWEWCVWCTRWTDSDPYQASVVVDKTRSTAIEGVDFMLEGTHMVFDDKSFFGKNVKLEVLSGKLSAPKILVLKLDYGYEDLNPVSSRQNNVLTITLQ